MKFSIVAAVDANWGIGRAGTIPWMGTEEHKLDMAHFRKLTSNNIVIMGRRTWQSLPSAYLSSRVNIIVTRSQYSAPVCARLDSPVLFVTSFEAALDASREFPGDVFVIGGEEIYRRAITHDNAGQCILTHIPARYDCDRFFPMEKLGMYTQTSSNPIVRVYGKQVTTNVPNTEESDYHKLCSSVLGCSLKPNRTGIPAHSLFASSLRFKLGTSAYRIMPLITSKFTPFRLVFHELMWFLSGATNTKYLKDNNVTIWDGNSSVDYLRSRNLPYEEGEVGPCFVPSTLIETSSSAMEIKDIQIGDEVLTHKKRYKRVVVVHRREYDGPIIRIALANGTSLVATPDHPIAVHSATMSYFLRAKEIAAGDLVGQPAERLTVDHVATEHYSGPVYNLTVEEDATYVANRCIVHNCYGFQWRSWGRRYGAESPGGSFDQLASVVSDLIKEPWSRRHVVSAWNPSDLPLMALPPCHYSYQFVPMPGDKHITLNCVVNMRSSDLALGVPFNIASYALLLHFVSAITKYEPGELVINMADVHIYANHVDGVREMISRAPYTFPRLVFGAKLQKNNLSLADVCNLEYADVGLVCYRSHPAIKLEMAV